MRQVDITTLSNHGSDSLPAGAPGEMSEVVEEDLEEGDNVVVGPDGSLGIGRPREIDQKGFSSDILSLQKAPFPGILAVVTVVPQDEILPWRYLERAEVVSVGVFRGVYLIIRMFGRIELFRRLAVNVQPLVYYLHSLTLAGNDPLYEVLARIQGIVKDDDVPHLRPGAPVGHLAHQKEIAGQERILHGARGDAVRLHHESAQQQPDNQGDAHGQGILLEFRFLYSSHRLPV